MMKLLIVDDEQNIREGLKASVDWTRYGYEICGEAENGVEALALAEKLQPDVIITDIKMPGMDGLQMIRAYKQKSQECKIILLTGYSEFQYAKQAIALGVESYLLKPIDDEELVNLINKVREEILEQKRLKDYLEGSIAIHSERLITDLVTQPAGEDFDYKSTQLAHLDLPWKSYQVLLIDMMESMTENRNIKRILRNEVDTFVEDHHYGHVFNHEGMLGILLKDVCFDENIKPLEIFNQRLKEKHKIDTVIAIGSYAECINEVHLSYERALKLIKNKFVWGSQKIVGYKKDIVSGIETKRRAIDTRDIAQKLYMAVDLNNKVQIDELLEELSEGLLFENQDESRIKSHFITIYYQVFNALMKSNEDLVKLNLENDIYSKRTIQELKEVLKNKFSAISDELARTRPDTPMKKILDYINRNFANDIKIEGLAQMFGYNSIYLGQLFKNHTTKYFTEYIEQVRIEKAKLLLKDGLKVYQVAERVGYKNLDYFSGKFKKHVGVSPSEYKDKIGKNDE